MSKVKYRFNTKSLTYEKVKVSFKQRALQVLSYLATGIVFAGNVLGGDIASFWRKNS